MSEEYIEEEIAVLEKYYAGLEKQLKEILEKEGK